jgi:hypothetical protein
MSRRLALRIEAIVVPSSTPATGKIVFGSGAERLTAIENTPCIVVFFIAEASDGSRCPACERIFELCRRLQRLQTRFLGKFRSEKNSCSGKQRTVAGV